MNVQFEKITAVYPAFSPTKNALMMEVDNLLGRFIEEMGDPKNMSMVSQSTGEVIFINEIRHVRGILDGLYHTCVWRVEE